MHTRYVDTKIIDTGSVRLKAFLSILVMPLGIVWLRNMVENTYLDRYLQHEWVFFKILFLLLTQWKCSYASKCFYNSVAITVLALYPLHQQRHLDHFESTANLNPHDLSHFVTESLGLARAHICILCRVPIIQAEKMLGYSSVRLRATQCNYDIFWWFWEK